MSFIKNRFKNLYGLDIVESPEIKDKIYINFECLDLNENILPYSDNQFCLIICSQTLEHLFNPFKLIKEIKRCLKHNGYLILGIPNACYIKNIISLIFGRVPRTAKKVRNFSKDMVWDGNHLHLFSLKDLEDMFNKFGFVIRNIHTSGKFGKFRGIYPSLLFSDLYITAKKIR